MIAKTAYLTAVEAGRFFQGRLDTRDWDAATVEEQNKALVQASTDIDKLNYIGRKSLATQEHEFPRSSYTDGEFIDNLDTDNVPLNIKYAVCLQAVELLGGYSVNQEIQNTKNMSQWIGNARMQRDVESPMRSGICPEAMQLLLPYLRDPSEIDLVRVN